MYCIKVSVIYANGREFLFTSHIIASSQEEAEVVAINDATELFTKKGRPSPKFKILKEE